MNGPPSQSPLTADAFPEPLAGFRRDAVAPQDPERPEVLLAVDYRSGVITARITLLRRESENVPAGPHSSAIYSEANRALSDLGSRVEIGMYDAVHIIDQLVTDRGAGETHFFAIEYEYLRHGKRIGAAVYLTGHRGVIVRIAMDHTEGRGGAARRFIHELGRLLEE